MKLVPVLLAAVLLSTLSAVSFAAESAGFIVRLGRDTTGVEQYTRDGAKLVVDQVGRSPRVLARHCEYELGPGGAVKTLAIRVTNPSSPAGSPPMQDIKANAARESVFVEIRRDTSVQNMKVAAPTGTAIVALSTPWAIYEAATMALAAGKPDSLRMPMLMLGADHVDAMTVRRFGRDSVAIENPEGIYHVQVDKAGHALHIVPIKGTAQFTVDRMAKVDLAAYTAQFQAREKQAGVMGALSPRDTVRASAGGAALWIDYGRPQKRGRVVFGGVVPFGDVWRTGANAATQFRTDKALRIGGSVVQPGMYTLWTIPSPGGWKLVINSETGQWGTEHKSEKDLMSLDMAVSALKEPVERFTIGVTASETGGTITMDWDTTRASVPFTVEK
jgi:hypothetical protein